MVLWPTLLGTLLPQRVVLIDDGGDEVVGLVLPLGRETLRVPVAAAEVTVVAKRVIFPERPDISEIK